MSQASSLFASIATYNVNSIRARLENVCDWLQDSGTDIVLVQEIKAQEETFPYAAIEELGYHVSIVGQKSYNGVAIFSKQPHTVTESRLPGDESDEQARYLEADVCGLRVATIYLPNGNPIDTDKFTYKLDWMRRLNAYAAGLLAQDVPFILGGDYNVCPLDKDCYSIKAMANDAQTQPESRDLWHQLQFMGLTDAFRVFDHREGQFSFWDYQAGAFQKDNGLRIDHLMLSPQVADHLQSCKIDTVPRGKPKASDHTPVVASIDTTFLPEFQAASAAAGETS